MKIALPKGRLLPGVLTYLAQRADLHFTFCNDRDYAPIASHPHILAKLFKPRGIPQLLALGQYDIGFCGLDLVKESGYEGIIPLLDLELSKVELVVAVSARFPDLLQNPPKRPLVIATEYPALADQWASSHHFAHITLQTYGSTEAYSPDEADIIIDCMETGITLKTNKLIVVDHLLSSSTWLVAAASSLRSAQTASSIQQFVQTLQKGNT